MFYRAQVIIQGKTSHISWRRSTFLKSSWQRRWSSTISWRQSNGKIAERDRSHVIAATWSLFYKAETLSHSLLLRYQAIKKYRGMFETQTSGNKTKLGEIGLNIRTHASSKVGQDQVSGGVSFLCWHSAPVANVLWKPFKFGNKFQIINRVTVDVHV